MIKNIIKISIILVLIIFNYTIPVYARAGGGSSGGSSGGGSATSSSTHILHTNTSNKNKNPMVSIFGYATILVIGSFSTIIITIKLQKAKVKTKIKIKDTSWNYKEIEKRVEKTYFVIQNAWTNNNIESAKNYLTKELYENFKSKLEWMELGNKKNVLKNIRLLKTYPISLKDEKDDENDEIWIYIKGKMVDYTINTKTNEIIEGNTISKVFVEYWLFSKNEKGEWILSRILQENEIDNIL